MSTTAQKPTPRTIDARKRDDLPEGWEVSSIGAILTVNYGKGLKAANRKPGKVSVYGSNGTVGKHGTPLTCGPTIIIGRKGTVGAVHFSPDACWPIDTTYYIDEFRGLDPEYVTFVLDHLPLGTLDTSTAIPGLNRDDLYEQEISIAPLTEQRRIVAKIGELFAQVNTTRVRLAKVAQILKRFRQAVLAAACSGRLTDEWRPKNGISEESEEYLIEDVADFQGGYAYRSRTFSAAGVNQVIRIGNVRPLSLHVEIAPVFVPDGVARATERFMLVPGDIVISMTGTKYKKDYGYAAVVSGADGKLFLNQRVARLRCGSKVLPNFLLFWLQTDLFRDFFFEGETGNVNQGNVGANGIKKAPIKLPPLLEQHEIVRRVEAFFKLADSIEKGVEKATKRADKLTHAILAKAFRGELVPTEAELARREGRDYEPASTLLSRIMTQSALSQTPPSKRTARSGRRNRG